MEMCIADDDKQGYYLCLYENWVLEILDLFFFYLSSIAKVILDVFSYMANIVLGKKNLTEVRPQMAYLSYRAIYISKVNRSHENIK